MEANIWQVIWGTRYQSCRLSIEALAKLLIDHNCHSERSEESRIFRRLRSLRFFQNDRKTVLQEAQLFALMMHGHPTRNRTGTIGGCNYPPYRGA